jgi:hypothetical protein
MTWNDFERLSHPESVHFIHDRMTLSHPTADPMSSDSEEEVRVPPVDGDAEENATQTPPKADEPSTGEPVDNADGQDATQQPAPPEPAPPTPPGREDRMSPSLPPLGWVLAGGAVATGVYLLRRLLSRRTGGPRRSQPKHLFLETLSLDRPSLPQSPVTPLLPDHKLAVSDRQVPFSLTSSYQTAPFNRFSHLQN